jgi:hypothetical protein
VLEHCKSLDWALGLGASVPRAEILQHLLHLISSHLILISPFFPLLLSLPPSKRDAVELNNCRPALISRSCAEDRRSDLPRSLKPAALIGRYPTWGRRGYETLAVKGQGSQDRRNSSAAGIFDLSTAKPSSGTTSGTSSDQVRLGRSSFMPFPALLSQPCLASRRALEEL